MSKKGKLSATKFLRKLIEDHVTRIFGADINYEGADINYEKTQIEGRCAIVHLYSGEKFKLTCSKVD